MYKNGKWWYTTITFKKQRITKSLKTTDKKEAAIRERLLQREIMAQLVTNTYDNRTEAPNEKKLIERFLKHKSNNNVWSLNTYRTYYYILNRILPKKDKFLNKSASTIASYKKHINSFYNWCNKNYQCDYKLHKIEEPDGRSRVFTKNELHIILNKMQDDTFRKLVNFAYYTGGRRHEVLNIVEKVDGGAFVKGKGRRGNKIRMLKITKQAEPYYDIYTYTDDYVTHHFKEEIRRLGIDDDSRFHDLRRTFGLNCLLNGITLHQLSKLLGHKSVRITEKHYAPLLPLQINDFVL